MKQCISAQQDNRIIYNSNHWKILFVTRYMYNRITVEYVIAIIVKYYPLFDMCSISHDICQLYKCFEPLPQVGGGGGSVLC
jgi:hypothetical protein